LLERANDVLTATAAAEYPSNIGHDFTLADAHDDAYLDVEAAAVEVEDANLVGAAERQALNAAMAVWYGIG
jgi:hypothetical protein